jgi:hypothetical protein
MSRETPVREPSLWHVVQAGTKVTKIPRGDREVLLYCEWLRLLVGRPLALAQRRSGSPHFEYLVFGVPLDQIPMDDEDAPARVRAAVNADFDVLRAVLKFHEQQLSATSVSSPERFLRSYELLEHLNLPESAGDWRVTDEGLTIVNWGLEEGKQLFRWRETDLNRIQSDVLQRIDGKLRAASSHVAHGSPSFGASVNEQLALVQQELGDRKGPRTRSPAVLAAPEKGRTVREARGPTQPRVGADLPLELEDESIWDKLRSLRLWLNIATIAVCALALLAIGFVSGRRSDPPIAEREAAKQPQGERSDSRPQTSDEQRSKEPSKKQGRSKSDGQADTEAKPRAPADSDASVNSPAEGSQKSPADGGSGAKETGSNKTEGSST